jgi:hypothetical protein
VTKPQVNRPLSALCEILPGIDFWILYFGGTCCLHLQCDYLLFRWMSYPLSPFWSCDWSKFLPTLPYNRHIPSNYYNIHLDQIVTLTIEAGHSFEKVETDLYYTVKKSKRRPSVEQQSPWEPGIVVILRCRGYGVLDMQNGWFSKEMHTEFW